MKNVEGDSRRFGWLFLILIACLAALSCGRSSDHEGPLRWGADAEGGAPYIFKDPKNPNLNIGYEVELADALAKELGRPIEFTQRDFRHLTFDLKRGDIDFAMNGLEMTPDRVAEVRFSRPYYIYKLQLVARAPENRFTSLDDCKKLPGIRIGTMENTAAERLLDELKINKKSYEGPVECYQDLQLGRTDGVLLDVPIAVHYAKPNQALKFVGAPVAEGYYGIAVRKEDASLAAALDKALEALLANGKLQRIYERWKLWNEDQDRLPRASAADIEPGERKDVRFSNYIGYLLEGAGLTVFITILSMSLAIVLALPIALGRLYGSVWVRTLALLYVEFFRGIPVLVLLYFLYYGLAGISEQYGLWIDLRLNPLVAAVLGFGLNYAAYEAEIYRAGISAVPVGQWEAAASLGMSSSMTFRRIILPQAIRNILPPMTNDLVALFKDTSLVSVIAVVELSKRFQILTKSGADWVELAAVTATLYLLMSVPLAHLARHLEKRWGTKA